MVGGKPAVAGYFLPGVRQDGVGRCQRRCGRTSRSSHSGRVASRLEGLCAILSKWFLPTRLETRTKESKTSASVVVEKPTRGMKVNGANFGAAPTDHDPLEKGLSKSVILRTRKMVNYACVG